MSADTSAPQPNSKKRSRKLAMTLAATLFIAIGAGYAVYWFVALRHHQTTDDAYVAGNQVQIMSQITGNVAAIYADNTDRVKKATFWSCLTKPMPFRRMSVRKLRWPTACVKRTS